MLWEKITINNITQTQQSLWRILMEQSKALYKGSLKTKLTHTQNTQNYRNERYTVNEKCTDIDATCAKTKTNWKQDGPNSWKGNKQWVMESTSSALEATEIWVVSLSEIICVYRDLIFPNDIIFASQTPNNKHSTKIIKAGDSGGKIEPLGPGTVRGLDAKNRENNCEWNSSVPLSA